MFDNTLMIFFADNGGPLVRVYGRPLVTLHALLWGSTWCMVHFCMQFAPCMGCIFMLGRFQQSADTVARRYKRQFDFTFSYSHVLMRGQTSFCTHSHILAYHIYSQGHHGNVRKQLSSEGEVICWFAGLLNMLAAILKC
jgi:hypothetical protein